ncbi:MAG TPA: 30S ribosomal protein S6 [Thermoguttaceae bacterium]|nr:30S ribosomal protein S6 [Thermoguttaceae bacterium]
MAENVYEGMYILDSNRYGRDHEGISGQIPEIIEKAGGQILVSRLWEERRLAYPINGHRKGTYWLTYFRLDGEKLTEVQRQCQLSESILRVLFLKVDPRIVDALVAHATVGQASSGGTDKPAAGADDKPADDKPAEAEKAVAVADPESKDDAPSE